MAAALAPGCTGAEGPPAPAPAPTAPPWPAAPPPPPSVDPRAWLEGDFVAEAPAPEPLEVTVLDPGAAPRAPLRYPTPPVALARRELTMRIDQSLGFVGTTTLQAGVPPWTVPLSMEAAAGAPDFTVHLGDARFDDVAPQGSVELLGGWAAHDGHLALDARGRTPPGQVPVFSQRAYELADTMRYADGFFAAWWPVFPEEPLGAGARWRVVDHPLLFGLELARTRTFTLVSGTPGARHLHVEMSLSTGPQAQLGYFRWRLVPGGFLGLDATLSAEVELDPASPLPRRADASLRVELTAHVPAQMGAPQMKPTTIIFSGRLR